MPDDEAAHPAEDDSSGVESPDDRTVDPFDGPGWDDAPRRRRTRTSEDQVRRRTTRARRRSRRRLILLGSGAVAFVLLAAVIWLAYTGLRARSELNVVRAQVHTLRAQIAAGDLDQARVTARSLAGHARQAHDLTTGPAWAAAAQIPYLGDPLDTVRASTTSVASIAETSLPLLVDASRDLDPSHLRRADGSFDLAPIVKVAPSLDRAAVAMRSALATVQGSSSSTWLGTVDDGRRLLLDQLRPLTSTVTNADVSARTVPTLLGANGSRSYMVSFQNEAELRATGGLPGAFAIIKADRGKLTFTRFESDSYLPNVSTGLNFGTAYNRMYLIDKTEPYSLYQDSNVSPNYPYAAQIWTALWQKKTGQHLDGAMTIDPTGLSYLLAVTGPAQLPDGSMVSASNVVALTQKTAYSRFDTKGTGPAATKTNNARKQFLLDIAKAVSERLVHGGGDTSGLVQAAAKATSQHRLLLWSRDPAVQNQLASTAIGGVVPVTDAPYAGLAINNAGPNKLDYYLHTSLDRRETGCGSTRDVTVTVKLSNRAPSSVPRYAQTPTGGSGRPKLPTTNRSQILYFATNGSSFTSVTVNGKPTGASSGLEQGHPVFGVIIQIPRNTPETIVYHLKEPAGKGSLISRMQPMINPVALSEQSDGCQS